MLPIIRIRWSGYTVNYCYDTYGLSYLKISTSPNQRPAPNQPSTAINQINIVRNDWNNSWVNGYSIYTVKVYGAEYPEGIGLDELLARIKSFKG